MMRYNITKIDSTSGKEIKYGVYNEEDTKLITRGYKQDKDIHTMYNRKGSKFFFMVEEVV